ncbi:hypothetical protein EIN_218430 [Entamoeba invadens IP1]|uniref:EGF-like domain-containing protein n=1 Tax=Entamoeba invadens IP1 TaxID=370355 RepID=L7FLX4_ENTIV|nr:hypothetical protein EIN_218430 [Entamoeba invadens IP1]ELP89531.1 hypothetical protein EIN_218430 [Entamoeba invadens IP1]|eukprot:XP_004256302.1 hypothetical protein EIN_218430 [Entamoeba invadens IP1]
MQILLFTAYLILCSKAIEESECYQLDNTKMCIKDKEGDKKCKDTLTIKATDMQPLCEGAFMDNVLITSFVYMPAQKVEIGAKAFKGATKLETVTIKNKIMSLGDEAFSGCVALTNIDVTGLTTIPTKCFEGCTSLATVTANDAVTTYEESSFKNSGLTKITFADTIIKIGDNAFSGTKMTTITFPKTDVTSFGKQVFEGIITLTHTDLAENTMIPEGTFLGCTKLNNVSGTQKVATVGKDAFKNCEKLENLNLYEPLTTLSDTLPNVKNLFFHGTASPATLPNDLNSDLRVYVTEKYTGSQFGVLKVLKAKCTNFECVDVTPDVAPAAKLAGEFTPKCIKCPNNFLSVDGNNYYCEYDMTVCLAAHPKCKVCAVDKCYQCQENKYLKEDLFECFDKCDDGYYSDDSTATSFKCKKCLAECQNCTDGIKCTSCPENKLLLEDTGKCVTATECPSGYYKDTTATAICKKCKTGSNCLTCESDSKCLSCIDGFYLTKEGTCSGCNTIKGCGKCKSATECTECTIDNLQPDKTCKPNCPEAYFAKDKVCTACVNDCKTCTEETKCAVCKDDALIVEDTKKCVKGNCPEMYFKDNEEKICKRCTDGCKVCSNATDCQECVAPKMLEEGTMRCVEKCGDGFFNVDNKKCDMCMDNCMTCAAKEKCDKCKENYFMSEDKCVDMCPEKYFEKQGKCEKCKDTYNTPCKQGDTECEVCMNKSGTLKVLVVALVFVLMIAF